MMEDQENENKIEDALLEERQVLGGKTCRPS